MASWSSTLPPLTKAAANQMCFRRTATGFGTKFQDNDGRVGLDLFCGLLLLSIDSYIIKMAVLVTEFEIIGINVIYI